MTPENQAKYDAKWKRIRDAIALTEPDRIPITPSPAIFPYLNYGYTVAEVIYDTYLERPETPTAGICWSLTRTTPPSSATMPARAR